MAAVGLIRHIREIRASTHPGKLDLLPLVQRLVELRQRGADGGCGLTHGTCAQQGHAGGRRKRGLGGAAPRERVEAVSVGQSPRSYSSVITIAESGRTSSVLGPFTQAGTRFRRCRDLEKP